MKGRKSRQRKEATKYLNVRLPLELHGDLVQAADEAKPRRSLNDEILGRLYHSFERERADDVLAQAQAERQGTLKVYGILAEKLNLPKLAQGTLTTPLGS